MARLSRFVTVVALLGGATVFLSACTGGTDPVASPSPTVSDVMTASPSASPSPTPLSDEELLALIPEGARAENFGGAVNFARFFLHEYQGMFERHDSALFALLSGPDCKFCASSLQSFAEAESDGITVVGGAVTPSEDVVHGGLQGDGTWLIQFAMRVDEAMYKNADGSLRSTDPAADYNIGMLLDRQEDHWIVLGLNFELAA